MHFLEPHEPECGRESPFSILCKACSALRHAYQRGREDAAQAISALLVVPIFGTGEKVQVSDIVHAARGYGE